MSLFSTLGSSVAFSKLNRLQANIHSSVISGLKFADGNPVVSTSNKTRVDKNSGREDF